MYCSRWEALGQSFVTFRLAPELEFQKNNLLDWHWYNTCMHCQLPANLYTAIPGILIKIFRDEYSTTDKLTVYHTITIIVTVWRWSIGRNIAQCCCIQMYRCTYIYCTSNNERVIYMYVYIPVQKSGCN